MLANYPALLITKLYLPRLRSAHLARPHLLNLLDSGLEHKLILVAAAAGFGKTSLVAEWSRQHPVAWLSLDEGDDDPTRFLSYLIAAIQTRLPDVGQELLAALQSPQPPAVENVLPILINQLAAAQQPLILALDDYHVIENQRIHAALTFMIDHLPPHINLMLLTRSDPALPLAKWRAKNELFELRAAALRFSVEESAHFLNQMMQLQLGDESVLALDTRTEGWIAGLQLAAIAMQSQPNDKAGFVRNFTGSHRFVLDYLMEEVLAQQPENIRQFLLQTSILHRLNPALCNAVTGQNDGQAMLEYLEKNNLFLIPLDQSRYWYRYHHLFADLLHARLQAEYPADLSMLFQRAAQWHENNHLPETAVDYALAAHDFDYAAQLITGAAANVARRGEVMTTLDWYNAFPPDFVQNHPQLCLHFVLAFILNGRWHEAKLMLTQINPLSTLTDELRLVALWVTGYQQDAASLAAQTAQIANSVELNRATKMVLALLVSMSGDLRYACQLMGEAQAASEREKDEMLALTTMFHQCRLLVFLGSLHEAHDLCQRALQRIHAIGNTALPMASLVHVSLVRILIEWNEVDQAAEHVAEAIRLGERSGFMAGLISSATMMLAEIKQAQGDTAGALQTTQTALGYAENYDPPPEILWLKTYQVRLWLIQGNTSAAVDWMRGIQQPQPASTYYPNSIQQVTQARILLAQRQPDAAISILTRLLTEPQDLLRVEALAVLALARQAQGDSVHAFLALEQALAMAEAENRLRALLDLGIPMAKLLARFCETHPDHAYAHSLIKMFPAASNPAQIEPLSDRELEILRLIVAGHSNEEIAQNLTLALSTVKWYINILYGKLGVKTRSQAIARAHALKIAISD